MVRLFVLRLFDRLRLLAGKELLALRIRQEEPTPVV